MVQAVRPDLADIRLAEHIFAPHYAAPVAMRVVTTASLHLAPKPDSVVLCTLQPKEIFEVLDIAAGRAWGIAVAAGTVGYVDRAVLGPLDGRENNR